MTKNATKQALHSVKIDKKSPKAGKGGVIPPKATRFGGEDANPRHSGAWKKEDTLRYKLQQIAKMTADELQDLLSDPKVGEYEKNAARTLLEMAGMDADKRWKVLEGLTNQDSGLPKQQIEQHNIELKPILPKPKKRKR